jgi:hypothetical protein
MFRSILAASVIVMALFTLANSADVNTGISGKTYLVTESQFAQLPIGTKYMVLTNDPNVFAGKTALLVSNDSPAQVLVQIVEFGWESAPERYPAPSNELLVEDGMIINWTVKALVDPLPGVCDEDLIKAMIFRGLHI